MIIDQVVIKHVNYEVCTRMTVSSIDTRNALPNEFAEGFIALVRHRHEMIRLPCHAIAHERYAEPDGPNEPDDVGYVHEPF